MYRVAEPMPSRWHFEGELGSHERHVTVNAFPDRDLRSLLNPTKLLASLEPVKASISMWGTSEVEKYSTDMQKTENDGRHKPDELRLFDLNPRFGPHIGITRRGRWRRAANFGLNPPQELWKSIDQATKETLSTFDLNPRFGPHMGISRIERWNRAEEFGLNPPVDIPRLLEDLCAERPALRLGTKDNALSGICKEYAPPKTKRGLNFITENAERDLGNLTSVAQIGKKPVRRQRRKLANIGAAMQSEFGLAHDAELAGRASSFAASEAFAQEQRKHRKRKLEEGNNVEEVAALLAIASDSQDVDNAMTILISATAPFREPGVYFGKQELSVAVTRDNLIGDEVNTVLRKFDLNPRFGPYMGISRLTRWRRASRLGLNPPASVLRLIEAQLSDRLQQFDLNYCYTLLVDAHGLKHWINARGFGLGTLEAIKITLEEVGAEPSPKRKRLYPSILGPKHISVVPSTQRAPTIIIERESVELDTVKLSEAYVGCVENIPQRTQRKNENTIVSETKMGNVNSLRQFDLNPRYGPHIGIDRLTRWHRAAKSGLNPPPGLLSLLEEQTAATLRKFDLNPHFGPFSGTSRIERWDRAKQFGLKPPEVVKNLLENWGDPLRAKVNSFAKRIPHRYPRLAGPMP